MFSGPQPLAALLSTAKAWDCTFARVVHLFSVLLVKVIEGQLLKGRNVAAGEESNVLDVRIVLVVANCVLATVGFARVVDELSRSAHELSVYDIGLVV